MARDTDLWQIFWNNFEFSSFHILHQRPCYPGRLVADTFLSKSPQYNECEHICAISTPLTPPPGAATQLWTRNSICLWVKQLNKSVSWPDWLLLFPPQSVSWPEVELLCFHSPSCCSRLADCDWLEGSLVDPGRDNSLYNILQPCRTAQGNWAQSQPIQAANSSITRSRVHCNC